MLVMNFSAGDPKPDTDIKQNGFWLRFLSSA
jgi:hypothetical protein